VKHLRTFLPTATKEAPGKDDDVVCDDDFTAIFPGIPSSFLIVVPLNGQKCNKDDVMDQEISARRHLPRRCCSHSLAAAAFFIIICF
jgi:hypothetical protein